MPNLIVISGTSGAGKSSALRQLEDEGFYCVDNLPPRLLPNFLDEVLSHRGYETFRGIGVCIDARAVKDEGDQRSLETTHLLEVGGGLMVFLDAKPHILLQRFSETRRRHPLASSDNSLTEAIKREKKMLEPIAAIADLLIDTSDLTTTNLREIINERVMQERAGLSILIQSFGFKRGVPTDADFVFDARAMPNPYWNKQLRPFSGRDERVKAFLRDDELARNTLFRIISFLTDSLPEFDDSDRRYLTVAIGCTGGQHRSVYVAEEIFQTLLRTYPDMQIKHRDLETSPAP